MRKLKLTLEDLAVESFVTERAGEAAGTVHGYYRPTVACDTVNATCDDGATCGGATCGGVAEYTCAFSCDTCDQYHCGTIQGYDCTNYLDCL